MKKRLITTIFLLNKKGIHCDNLDSHSIYIILTDFNILNFIDLVVISLFSLKLENITNKNATKFQF